MLCSRTKLLNIAHLEDCSRQKRARPSAAYGEPATIGADGQSIYLDHFTAGRHGAAGQQRQRASDLSARIRGLLLRDHAARFQGGQLTRQHAKNTGCHDLLNIETLVGEEVVGETTGFLDEQNPRRAVPRVDM